MKVKNDRPILPQRVNSGEFISVYIKQPKKHCRTVADVSVSVTVIVTQRPLPIRKRKKKLCQLAHLEIRRIGSVRQYLSYEATKTFISSLVLSRLNYYNAAAGFNTN